MTKANTTKPAEKSVNPQYTGGLFHCYMLDESICHFTGVRSILSLLFYLLFENPLSKQCRLYQVPGYVASNLGLHCLPMILLLGSP